MTNEPFIYIDSDTREVDTNNSLSQFITVSEDHNAETIYFVIDRYFDNVDLYDKNCVIKYVNAVGQIDFEPAVDIDSIMIDGVEKIKFGWTISNKASRYAGKLIFQIMFYSINGTANKGTYDYVFNTKISNIVIEEGLNYSSGINVSNLPDWAHSLYQQIKELKREIKTLKENL